MSFNLRDALNGIFMKAEYTPTSDYSQFAVNSYLSKYKQYIPILNKIMCLSLPNQAHYDYLKKTCGFGWPAKREIKTIEEEPIIKYLMQYYECSRLDAKDYLMFISLQEKEMVRTYFEDGDNDGKSSINR